MAQKSSFEELEIGLYDFFEAELSSEIDTTSINGNTALFAELELVKTKTKIIEKNLIKGDIYSSLESPNSATVVSLAYCMLVFEDLDFKFTELFLNNLMNKERLNQEEKRCMIDALQEYNVDKTSIKDFSKSESSNDLQLYLSTVLGFFKGCNAQ